MVSDSAEEIKASAVFADMVNQAKVGWAALVNSFTSTLVKATEKEEDKYYKVKGELMEMVAQLGQAAAVEAFKFTPTK